MATTADAEIILKLYELRRDPEMRKARDYIGNEFWPESYDGFVERNRHERRQESLVQAGVRLWGNGSGACGLRRGG